MPGKYFDLFSFEVKPNWSVNVTAVYEALAHRRAATHAYVWFHIPEEEAEEFSEALDAIASEGKALRRRCYRLFQSEDAESTPTPEPAPRRGRG